MRACRAGFTLLELCLALLIGALVIMMAIPSVSGLIAEQRLKRSFDRFDQLVATAVSRSTAEQRAYALTLEDHRVQLVPLEDKAHPGTEDGLDLSDDEKIEFQFPAALARHPAAKWVFWNNGLCEPAVVSFQSSTGTWQVRYDPLTAHGQFLNSSVR